MQPEVAEILTIAIPGAEKPGILTFTFLIYDAVRPQSCRDPLGWLDKPDSLKPLYVADPQKR